MGWAYTRNYVEKTVISCLDKHYWVQIRATNVLAFFHSTSFTETKQWRSLTLIVSPKRAHLLPNKSLETFNGFFWSWKPVKFRCKRFSNIYGFFCMSCTCWSFQKGYVVTCLSKEEQRCVWVIRKWWPWSSTPDLEFFERGNKKSITKWRMWKSRIRTRDPVISSPTL